MKITRYNLLLQDPAVARIESLSVRGVLPRVGEKISIGSLSDLPIEPSRWGDYNVTVVCHSISASEDLVEKDRSSEDEKGLECISRIFVYTEKERKR